MLIRLAYSLDLVLSCFGLRADVKEDFLGRDRGIGGSVEDLPGGDLSSIEGSNSRGRFPPNELKGPSSK